MPGAAAKEAPHMGVGAASPGASLQGQEGPLSYLRSRNALKIILDLDGEFGRPGVPGKEKWKMLPKIVGGGGGASS